MYLLFDIGGTKMRLAFSKDGKTFGKTQIVSTPQNFNDGIKLFSKIALKLSKGDKITAIAGGIAGALDRQNSKLVASPHLSKWVNKPLQKKLEKIFHAPVFIENDTAVVGLGEAAIGAGKDKGIVVYMTISTGVGGARITDGTIDENSMGFEPGHHIINFNSDFCLNYGTAGDLESYVSGSALEELHKKHPAKIRDKKVWRDVNLHLAYGLHNVIVFWSPDIIVLGGGMMKSKEIKLATIRRHLKKTLKIFPSVPEIKRSKLKDVGGLHGALYYAKQRCEGGKCDYVNL